MGVCKKELVNVSLKFEGGGGLELNIPDLTQVCLCDVCLVAVDDKFSLPNNLLVDVRQSLFFDPNSRAKRNVPLPPK